MLDKIIYINYNQNVANPKTAGDRKVVRFPPAEVRMKAFVFSCPSRIFGMDIFIFRR